MRKHKYLNIETGYSELTADKFCKLAAVIYDNKTIPLNEYRIKVLEVLTGQSIEAKKANCSQFVAELTSFVFKLRYNADVFNLLKPETKALLRKCHPQEITDKDAIADIKPKYNLLQPSIDINYSIKSNPIQQLTINNIVFNGPIFEIDKSGILNTSLVAGEWIDACEYMSILAITQNAEYLKNIATCLYRPEGEKYDTNKAQQRAKMFSNIPAEKLKAIWLVFRSMQKTLIAYPTFSVLFKEKSIDDEADSDKINIGSSEIFYQLSKDGYGSFNDMTNISVIDFFSIQVKNIRDGIHALRDLKQSNSQIAKALNMDIETVLKF